VPADSTVTHGVKRVASAKRKGKNSMNTVSTQTDYKKKFPPKGPCSLELFSGISSHPAVFFSHNKPANSTFSHNKPAKRTGYLYHHSMGDTCACVSGSAPLGLSHDGWCSARAPFHKANVGSTAGTCVTRRVGVCTQFGWILYPLDFFYTWQAMEAANGVMARSTSNGRYVVCLCSAYASQAAKLPAWKIIAPHQYHI
jgi:hypothetical protein